MRENAGIPSTDDQEAGGRWEPGDRDLEATARRETLEEIGLDLEAVAEPLGALDEVRAMARLRPLDLSIVVRGLGTSVSEQRRPTPEPCLSVVMPCYNEIGTVERVPEFVKRAKDKNSNFRLMGFGHRVYKNYDPRAKIMQKTAHEVLSELGHRDDPLLQVAIELERVALSDEYFIEKKLYPNVDFYSGITLKAMGFPTTMFTVLFALARTAGWIAQWKEMIEDPEQRIGRPRQLYKGEVERSYSPLDRR